MSGETKGPVPDDLKTVSMEVAEAVAMKSPAHLKRWLDETGRMYLILRSDHLVDALPFPDGLELFIQVLEAYRQQRRALSEYDQPCPQETNHKPNKTCWLCRNEDKVAAKVRSDKLTLTELLQAREFIDAEIEAKRREVEKYVAKGCVENKE